MAPTFTARKCSWCLGSMEGKKASARCCSQRCNHLLLAQRRRDEKWAGVDPDRPCARCGKPLTGQRPHATYCSRACKTAVAEVRRRADPRRRQAQVRKPRQGGACAWCSASLDGRHSRTVYCTPTCRQQARYDRDGEHIRAYAMRYLRENPERMRAIRRRRKGQLKAEAKVFTERDWRRLVARYRGCCAYCGEPSATLQREHVIPLARGGRHSIGNILPACPRCNGSKKTRYIVEWRLARRKDVRR